MRRVNHLRNWLHHAEHPRLLYADPRQTRPRHLSARQSHLSLSLRHFVQATQSARATANGNIMRRADGKKIAPTIRAASVEKSMYIFLFNAAEVSGFAYSGEVDR